MGLRPLFSRKQVIISKFVTIKPRNHSKMWSTILGYKVSYHDTVSVPIELMPKNSNKIVDAKCDLCGIKFSRSIQLLNRTPTHACRKCSIKQVAIKNSEVQSGISRPWQRGDKHPRWTGKRKEFALYASRVHSITKSAKIRKIWSKWPNADKIGVCGTKGAYQLDHKVSIKYGFDNLIPPEIIASVKNLEIITWESNREKSKRNSVDLWDLLE